MQNPERYKILREQRPPGRFNMLLIRHRNRVLTLQTIDDLFPFVLISWKSSSEPYIFP